MKFQQKFRLLTFLIIIFSLALTACSNQPAPAPVVEGEPQTETPPEAQPSQPVGDAQQKTITILFPQEITALSPLYTTSYFERIIHQLWNAWAWDFDEQNNPRPLLMSEIPSSENGGISPDGRVITMRLRQDLVWSDGEPLTSQDFLFTYQMFISSNNQVANREPYSQLESLETPDAHTVVMTFAAPYAPWRAVSWHGLLPYHILNPIFDAEGTVDNAEWNLQPTVGCGPYIFAEWTPGSHVRFTANPNYWLGKPAIDEILIRFVADSEQVAALTTGVGDMGTFFAFSDIPNLEAAGLSVSKVFSGFNEGLSFYLNPVYGHPALQDIRVRQAIAMAIDRQTLLNELFGGQAQGAISYWDNTPYLDPALTPWPYDPARSAALLDEAGWIDSNGDGLRDRDGVDLALTYGTTTREIRQKAQAMIREQLLLVGIRLDLIDYPPSVFFSGFAEAGPAATGQLDVYQLSSAIRFPDPDTADFLCSQLASMQNPGGVNWIAFCNQELNDLLVQQLSQVGSPDTERQQTFHQISRIVFERAYFIGLWQDPDVWALNRRLANVRLSGVTPFFNVLEWDVVE